MSTEKYHELDKTVSAGIIAEFRGKVVPEECRSCKGYGHFKANGKPSIDKRDRKCLDCGGTGTINRQY